MPKKYRVTLTAEEREELDRLLSRGKADVRCLKHAQMLLPILLGIGFFASLTGHLFVSRLELSLGHVRHFYYRFFDILGCLQNHVTRTLC